MKWSISGHLASHCVFESLQGRSGQLFWLKTYLVCLAELKELPVGDQPFFAHVRTHISKLTVAIAWWVYRELCFWTDGLSSSSYWSWLQRAVPFWDISPSSRHSALFTVRGDQLLGGPHLFPFITCSLPHAVIPKGYRVRWKDARSGVKTPGFHILVCWMADISFSTLFPGVFIEPQWNDCKPCTQITSVSLCFGCFIWKMMIVTANTVLTLSQAIP